MPALLIFLLAGCDSDPVSQCSPSAEAGTLAATINGEDWLGESLTWLWSGDSVQLTTSGTDRITAVGHRDPSGVSVSDLLDTVPITISLDDVDGWAVLYEGSESSRSSSGELVITEHNEAGSLVGCIAFETDSGATIEDGSFSADHFEN